MCHTSANVIKITELSYTVSLHPSRHPEERSRVYPERSRRGRISSACHARLDRASHPRTLISMQAPSMANTIAIDSKEGPQTKPKGSRTFLCAFRPCFWGESPDKGRFFHTSSGFLGRLSGRGVSRHVTPQAQIRMFSDTQSHRQKSEWFTICDPIGTSQAVRAFRSRSHSLT